MNVYERQFLDILFRCPNCASLCRSLERMPREPIPATTVLFRSGRYRLGSLNLRDTPVLFAGERAVTGYVNETGARYGDLHHVLTPRVPLELNVAAFRSLAADTVRLLGDRYHLLDAADKRGPRSPTPPAW